MTGHTIGPSGVALKLIGPLKCSHKEIAGVIDDWRRSLNVSSVCGRIWSHRKLGK